jgi:hypothetical protein
VEKIIKILPIPETMQGLDINQRRMKGRKEQKKKKKKPFPDICASMLVFL